MGSLCKYRYVENVKGGSISSKARCYLWEYSTGIVGFNRNRSKEHLVINSNNVNLSGRIIN